MIVIDNSQLCKDVCGENEEVTGGKAEGDCALIVILCSV